MIKTLLAATIVLCAASPAAAHPESCKADLEKHCKGVAPGGGRLVQCLRDHRKDLAPECKKDLEEVREDMKEVKDACKADVDKLCKGVEPGEGRILACLRKNQKSVSAECKKELEDARKHRKDRK